MRAQVARAFTPRAVETARPRAAEVAGRLADELAARGRADVVADFAVPYVADVTGFHTGLDPADVARAWPAVMAVAHASKDLNGRAEEFAAALRACWRTSRSRSWRARRTEDDDTAVALLAAAVAAGDIAPSVAAALVATIFSAGHEPTINQLAIAVGVLADTPTCRDGLASGEMPAPAVVEEVLRLRSTNVAATRKVTCPVAHHGAELRAGRAGRRGARRGQPRPVALRRPARGSTSPARPGPRSPSGSARTTASAPLSPGSSCRRACWPWPAGSPAPLSWTRSRRRAAGLRGPTSLIIDYQARPRRLTCGVRAQRSHTTPAPGSWIAFGRLNHVLGLDSACVLARPLSRSDRGRAVGGRAGRVS